ncbi:MAG: single-stranded DNA-binding protein [Saprospiraceae bacterium]|nr:single-stranded DNA-binding protein [Saprospiraceae bacterium]
MNKVFLLGNLGKDPEFRKLDNGTQVAKFPIATNESYKDKAGEWKQITEWHDVVCWRDLATRVEKNLKKGSTILVEGKLSHRKYTDANGVDRYITEVVAASIKQLDKKDPSQSTGANFPTSPAAEEAIDPFDIPMPASADEDLPF